MNANDHVPMVHILPFGFCKKGMPCMPLTPLAWVDVNKKHIIEGAPALTEDSKLACFHGGVITIVPLDAGSAEEGDRNENAEDSVESIAAEALAFAGSLAGKGKGKLIKNLAKKNPKNNGVKNNKGNGSNSAENNGAASNRSLDRSGNSGGKVNEAEQITGDNIVFGSDTKSAQKLSKQMDQRGWSDSTVRDTVSNPYTTRTSTNKATGNPATVYYNQSGGYVIIDDVTKAVVQVSDNINPSTWIPDPSIINPYKP